jgi:RNA recognition motif-containing protein
MATKLYVGNLSFNTTEETLRSLFEADGRRVEEIAIVTDRATGQPRGFAFIQMGSPEDARSAISDLNGRDVDGRQLTVSEAKPRPEGSGGGGRGGRSGGGYGGGGGGGSRGGYGRDRR